MGHLGIRRLELILFGIGTVAAVLFGLLSIPSILARSAAPQTGNEDQIFTTDAFSRAYAGRTTSIPASSLLGRMRIAALNIDAPVIEGVEVSDLRRGIGHVPNSATAGGLGNMIVAAHRDGVFRPLRDVRKGMDIQVEELNGTFHYQVDSWQVVSPDRLDIMAIASQPEITLITCYPFNFIGSAPMRFIVKAHLVSALPDSAAAVQ